VAALKGAAQLVQTYTGNVSLLDQAFNQSCTAQNRPLSDGIVQSLAWTAANGQKSRHPVRRGTGPGKRSTASARFAPRRRRASPFLSFIWEAPRARTAPSGAQPGTREDGFFEVPNHDALEAAVGLIGEMLRNHYVFSHASPDTLQDSTWRIVEAALSAYEKTQPTRVVPLAPGFVNLSVSMTARGHVRGPERRRHHLVRGDQRRGLFRHHPEEHRAQDGRNVRLNAVLPHSLVPAGTGL